MTLTKAIDAAREALKHASAVLFLDHFYKEPKIPAVKAAYDIVDKALAALPDKPMTEDEIDALIRYEVCNNGDLRLGVNVDKCVESIITALKAANVLYVEE